jgi:hypothetical protein
MAPKRKKDLDSDADYKAPSAPKRPRREVAENLFFQTSSAPTSPHPGPSRTRSPDNSEDEEMDEMTPLPDIMSRLVGSLPTLEPLTSAACTPPRKGRLRAVSESPVHIPSPATSTIFEPSPVKRGRPRVLNPQRHSRVYNRNLTSDSHEDIRSSGQVRSQAKKAGV